MNQSFLEMIVASWTEAKKKKRERENKYLIAT